MEREIPEYKGRHSRKPRITEVDIRIGKNLKLLREAAGLTQESLAQELDVTFQQVQKYERGINRLPIAKLYKLKQLYNIPYDRFFKGIDHENENECDWLADDIALDVCHKVALIKDRHLKEKVEKIVEVLLT